MTLTVDGIYTERWMGSGGFSFLASYTAFVGGSEATYSLPGTKTNNNLVGCMKKVNFFLFFFKLKVENTDLISIRSKAQFSFPLSVKKGRMVRHSIFFPTGKMG